MLFTFCVAESRVSSFADPLNAPGALILKDYGRVSVAKCFSRLPNLITHGAEIT